MNFDIYHGDCVDVMSLLIEDNSIDAIVCDPPAGIGFMGKEWDHHKLQCSKASTSSALSAKRSTSK